MKKVLLYWLFTAIVLSGMTGLLYIVMQQNLRLDANDPQIQMAEDAATALTNGQSLQSVIPLQKVTLENSLAPYIIVFDATGKPIASSGQLHGQTPTIPAGVFDSVKQSGEDKITWQPQAGIRSALVVTSFSSSSSSGFVAAGRSLREVEAREDTLLQLVALGWGGLLIVTLLAAVLLFRRPIRTVATSIS